MNIEDRYLSDEELELLILEVEENELVSAPPGFMEEILLKMEDLQTQQKENQDISDEQITMMLVKSGQSTKSQKMEDVVGAQDNSVSISESKIVEFRRYCLRVITSAAAAIAILFALPSTEPVEIQQVPTRQELVGKSISREDALDDTGFLTKIMNGLNNRNGGLSNETEKEE